MKLALVVERFEERGGVELAAFELVRELARRGLEPTVVCRDAVSPAPPGVTVRELSVPTGWQPLRLGLFSRRAAAATAVGFDLVHSYARTRRQHIYRAGGGAHRAYLERSYRNPGLQRLSPRHRAILRIEEAVFRDPTQVIQCISKRDAGEIARRYGVPEERLVTIYNGADIVRFDPAHRAGLREPTRQALGIEGPVALFVGNGFRRKGLDRAIEGLASSGVKAHLLVAGSDPPGAFGALARQRGVAERVHFLGRRDDIAALYAAADLLVLPSRYDPFGNTSLEAMAAGLPVAASPGAGSSELVEPGVNGMICQEDFAPAFTALRDLAALARQGEAARRTVEAITWVHHADRVLELYARVLERR